MTKSAPSRDFVETHVLLSAKDLAILSRKLGPRHALTRRVREQLAEVGNPVLARYRRAAMRETRSGTLEVDPAAVVSKGADAGAYVMAWLWISDDAAGIRPSP